MHAPSSMRSERAVGVGPAWTWTWLVVRIEEMITIRRERRALLSASDHMLRDLGLSRADAYREGSWPIWRPWPMSHRRRVTPAVPITG